MALLNTDLFVIQRPSDANKHFKLTGEKLKEYITTGDTTLDARVTVNEGDIADIKADIVTINTEIDDITLELETLTNGGGGGGGSSEVLVLKGADPIEVTTSTPDADGKTETTVSIKDGTTAQKGAIQLQETGAAKSASITTGATPGYVDVYYLAKPGREGTFVIVEDSTGAISYSEAVDGGTY